MDDLEKKLREEILRIRNGYFRLNDREKHLLDLHTRCLEAIAWRSEGDPPVDEWVLFYRDSTGEYMVDMPDKDEMPGEWKRGGWSKWRPITPKGED